MHEISLCTALARTVSRHAAGNEVRQVNVRIGHFRQVVPETLTFCWSSTIEGTDLAGAELVVDYVPAVVRCRHCGAETTLEDPFLLCGACDSVDVELLQGDELSIQSIDVTQRVG